MRDCQEACRVKHSNELHCVNRCYCPDNLRSDESTVNHWLRRAIRPVDYVLLVQLGAAGFRVMVIQIKHAEDIIYATADHEIGGVRLATKLDRSDIIVVALDKATNGLLQLVDVPYQQILVCPCSNHRRVCPTGVERGAAATRIDLRHALIGASVPKFDQSILACCHEDVHQILILRESRWAMNCSDWLVMLFFCSL